MIINYKLIGKRIKEQRLKLGYTQEDIAEHLDISASYVSRIERAAVKISLETLVRTAMFLDVTPAYLIDGTVSVASDYLHCELANTVSGMTPEQMGLLLDIAKVIRKER